jgi:hypothetical protein
MTVKVCPATVIVPVRAAPAFAATVKFAGPLPVSPAVTPVTHGTLLVAVQLQEALVETSTWLEPPPAPNDRLSGLIVYVHVLAACVIVNVCPAMVTAPDRAGPELVRTARLTVPFPLPVAPDAIVIQLTALVAVHAQAGAVVTADEVEPPAADIGVAGDVVE